MDVMIDLLRWSGFPLIDFATALLLLGLGMKLLDLVIDLILGRLVSWTRLELDDLAVAALHGPAMALAGLLGLAGSLRLLVVPLEIEVGRSEQKAQLAREAARAIADPAGGRLLRLAKLNLAPEQLETADRLLWTLAFLAIALAAGRLVGLAVEGMGQRADGAGSLAREMGPLLVNLGKVAVLLAAAVGVLSIWDISITPLLASAGVVGLAVALAAQESLANFFGGVSLFLDRSYQIGDYIVLDGEERGAVEHLGLRSTRLRTRDDVLITIPNSIMAASKVVNQSGPGGRFRVRLPVGIAYGADIDAAERQMLEAAAGEDLVLDRPEPRVRFRAFGDSSLNLELLCWCADPAERGLLVHRLGKDVYRRFEAEGVLIPFPQLDVHLHRDGSKEEHDG